MRRAALLALLLVIASGRALAQRERIPPDDLDVVESTWPQAQKTSTCIRYIVEREGEGRPPAPGDQVAVLYTGKFLDGRVFESNVHGRPFKFRVRRGEVIDGWDEMLQRMRPGSKWLVIIPPELAYGSRGSPPKIPRDTTLVFEIELLEVIREN